ncbi:MAG: hypothetical protein K8H90_00690 [Thermoanaerobaculia bacterium]|nr:hypothetical protein [Thermoanaerobaculia bacterium]
MPAGSRIRLAVFSLVLAVAAAAVAQGVTVPFRTHFGLDTVGLPPGLGGEGQPSGMTVPAGSSVTVVGSAFGLDTQPVEVDAPNGAATWLNWNLVPAVADVGVEIRFSASFASAYSGIFFDAAGTGGVKVRLRTTAAGELTVSDGCSATPLGSYTPGTPVDVVVQFAPPSSIWVIADGENDGFDDNVPVAGEICNPGNLNALHVYAWGTLDDAATAAFDDLEVEWLPIFADDFESSDTAAWSLEQPAP